MSVWRAVGKRLYSTAEDYVVEAVGSGTVRSNGRRSGVVGRRLRDGGQPMAASSSEIFPLQPSLTRLRGDQPRLPDDNGELFQHTEALSTLPEGCGVATPANRYRATGWLGPGREDLVTPATQSAGQKSRCKASTLRQRENRTGLWELLRPMLVLVLEQCRSRELLRCIV